MSRVGSDVMSWMETHPSGDRRIRQGAGKKDMQIVTMCQWENINWHG